MYLSVLSDGNEKKKENINSKRNQKNHRRLLCSSLCKQTWKLNEIDNLLESVFLIQTILIKTNHKRWKI